MALGDTSQRIGVVSIEPSFPNPQRRTFPQLYHDIGRNTGNLMFTQAMFRQLAGSVEHISFGFDPVKVNETFDGLVIPAANWLNASSDWGWFCDRLDQLRVPFVTIGLGVQAPSLDLASVAVHESARRLAVTLSRGSRSISVRGEFTRQWLQSIGIENVVVTGCPSLYMPVADGLPEPDRSGVILQATRYSATSAFAEADSLNHALFRLAAAQGCDMIYQSEPEEIEHLVYGSMASPFRPVVRDALARIYGVRTVDEVIAFLKSHGHVFFDIDDWATFLRSRSCLFGTRLHGTILALNCGIPAVLFGHDSRTSEVASFAAIPTLDPDHFMKRFASRGAPDVIPLTMMDRYYERRGQNSLIYARFLDENRLLPDETSLLRGEAAPSYSRKVNVMTTTYEHKLGSFVPDFYWFRTYHTVHGDNVAILAMIAAGSPFQAGELVAEVDGVPATIEPLPDDEYTTKTFWFLPPTQRTGAWLRVKRSDLPDPSAKWHVVRLTPRGHGGEAFTTLRTRADFGITFDLDQHGPVPPLEYIERVSGKGAVPYNYFNNGWTDARRFMRIAKEHGVDVTNRKVKVLDWGCGCGRLTRHFLSLPGGEGRIFGSDIDPVNVAWDRDHLSAKAFSVNGLMPPFDFAKNSFDLVFANSVMSHLQRDAAHAWLAELRRILKPGGLALLSYHGEFSLATLLARSQPFVDRVLKSGFDAETRSTDLNDVISDPEYYRQTFMTDASAKALFEQYFDVKEQIVGVVSRYQNLAILKKRS